MIADILLNTINWVVQFFISLLPNSGELPDGITNAFSTFASYWNMANSILPMNTFFSIIVLGLAFEAGYLTFKLINFVVNKVRGSG